jgi:hypothetical protein
VALRQRGSREMPPQKLRAAKNQYAHDAILSHISNRRGRGLQ